MGEFAYRGSMSVGAAIPLASTSQAQLDASLSVLLPEAQAKLTGMLEVQARFILSPPTLEVSLAAALALVASLQAQISAGLPGAQIDLVAIAAVVAELEATIGSLQASASFSLSLASLLATGGVNVWTYTGDAGGLVPGWAPGGDAAASTWGIVLAANGSASRTALQTMFGIAA